MSNTASHSSRATVWCANFVFMYKLVTSMLITFLAHTVYSQTCVHNRLSHKYIFTVTLDRPTPGADYENISVAVSIADKVSKAQVQKIVISTNYLFSEVFVDCNNVRSYTTGLNKNREDIDNDYGDLIVADFNFDSKEDFALKKDSGGNGGPVYNFYIQNEQGSFSLDTFLTRKMEFFPTHIKRSNKTLVTLVHANAYQLGEHTYRLDKNGWKEIKHRFLTVH